MQASKGSERGLRRSRAAFAVSTAMAIALSASGLALANELPKRAPHIPLPTVQGVPLTPRASRTPAPTAQERALRKLSRIPKKKRSPEVRRRRYRLPVSRRLIEASQLDRPHHDYPAWDLAVPIGTKVVAVHAGVVEEVSDSGRCGNGVVVVARDDYVYTYCHGSKLLVDVGAKVASGGILMLSGSSGRSTGPHLHLQIESPTGTLLCPQSLVSSWFHGGQAGPETAVATGCFYMTHHRAHHGHRRHHSAGHNGAGSPAPSGGSVPRPKPSPSQARNESSGARPGPSTSPRPRPSPSPSPTPLPLPSPSLT